LSQISAAEGLGVPRVCQSVGASRVDEAAEAVMALARDGEGTRRRSLPAYPLRTKRHLEPIRVLKPLTGIEVII
jgi:hypothetical protein